MEKLLKVKLQDLIVDDKIYLIKFDERNISFSLLSRNSTGMIMDVLQYGHYMEAEPSPSKSNGAEQLGQLKLCVIIYISIPLSILYYISKLTEQDGVKHNIEPL